MTLLPSLLVALAAADTAAPAAGVLVSLRAPVRIERPGVPAPAPELGMRLMKGDVVVVGSGGSAMLYLAGGEIERVPEGSRFEVAGGGAAAPRGSTKLASSSVKSSESGLWVLNDPDGSILVAAMRGEDASPWTGEAMDVRSDPLSPRYETTATRRPPFVAALGARPARLAVAAGKTVVWRSGPLDGPPPWVPEGFPELDAGAVHLWRLESAGDGTPLSEWVPFRVPSAAEADAGAAFESEMNALASSGDGAAAADVLRCGRYLQSSSWTALLGAATRLLERDPASTVARRAKESAARGLRLGPEQLAILAPAAK